MSSGSSRNQTLSFLMGRFREAGIRPYTRLGQNFLVDLNLLRLLLKTADLGPDDVVLEVGTGTGSLTHLLAEQVRAVVTVEVDPQLFQLASEELQGLSNVTRLQLDVLKGKNRLNPLVLDAVREQVAAAPGRSWKVVANLPYHIASPLLMNLLALDEPPRLMAVTVQKEVAERIVARPGVKSYGAMSIWIQSQCRVELVRIMSPTVFWPRPKVESAIVAIALDDARRGRIHDRAQFHQFVRALFTHRRKLLRSELAAAFKHRLSGPEREAIVARLGLGPEARAEQLDPDTILALAEAFGPVDGPVPGARGGD